MQVWSLVLVFLLLFSGCSTSHNSKEVVAQVGSKKLYEQTIDAAVGKDAPAEIRIRYVKEWVDNALLAQAAYKSNLDKDPQIQEEIDGVVQSILATRYLTEKVGSVGDVSLTSEAVSNYFNQNRAKYLREEPVIRFTTLSFATNKKAWKFRKKLTVASFLSTKEKIDSTPLHLDTLPFVPLSDVGDAQLQNYLISLDSMTISLPRTFKGDQTIFLVVDHDTAGSLASFEEVKDQVVLDATIAQYHHKVQQIKDSLRQSADYYYNDSLLTQESLKEPLREN